MSELTPMENLRVWLQDLIDSERTIMCSPEWESRIKTLVALSPCAGLWTVTVMPWMSDDLVYVVDHNAMEASARQSMQRLLNEPPLLSRYPESTPLSERYRDVPPFPHYWPKPDPSAFWGGPVA